MSKLKTWGFTSFFSDQLSESDLRSYIVGRIINQEKGGYKLITEQGIKPGQLSGRYEFNCIEEKDFPAVGDWVLCFGEDVLMVDRLLTRKSLLARKKVGGGSQSQSCAVIKAVTDGLTGEDRIKSWKKMQREQRYQEAARDQRLMSNIKKEYKQLAKRIRASQKKGFF